MFVFVSRLCCYLYVITETQAEKQLIMHAYVSIEDKLTWP